MEKEKICDELIKTIKKNKTESHEYLYKSPENLNLECKSFQAIRFMDIENDREAIFSLCKEENFYVELIEDLLNDYKKKKLSYTYFVYIEVNENVEKVLGFCISDTKLHILGISEINLFYIGKEHRRKGIGTIMAKYVFMTLGCKNLSLLTHPKVLTVKFWRSIGFGCSNNKNFDKLITKWEKENIESFSQEQEWNDFCEKNAIRIYSDGTFPMFLNYKLTENK